MLVASSIGASARTAGAPSSWKDELGVAVALGSIDNRDGVLSRRLAPPAPGAGLEHRQALGDHAVDLRGGDAEQTADTNVADGAGVDVFAQLRRAHREASGSDLGT